MLDRDAHLATIEREGRRLAMAASAAGPGAIVPTCPEWSMRDLVLHQGEVHRWAALVVAEGIAKPSAVPADHLGPLPGDEELVAWFTDGLDGLLRALGEAPDDVAAFTFLADAPAPALFWPRRQAHETEMHRVDAESALRVLTPFETASAVDGVDEMLVGFVPRKHTPFHLDPSRTLAVHLTDDASAWHLMISDEPAITRRIEPGETIVADCTVRGPASDVYLALWNRQGVDPLEITGDASVFDAFRTSVRISWA
ncbi:MAG: hypothetical protein JWL72_998 [Ilumatobacteraceae bacterium]|nr:hypothetical protein [Ilumatobacteraceae bacterium]